MKFEKKKFLFVCVSPKYFESDTLNIRMLILHRKMKQKNIES